MGWLGFSRFRWVLPIIFYCSCVVLNSANSKSDGEELHFLFGRLSHIGEVRLCKSPNTKNVAINASDCDYYHDAIWNRDLSVAGKISQYKVFRLGISLRYFPKRPPRVEVLTIRDILNLDPSMTSNVVRNGFSHVFQIVSRGVSTNSIGLWKEWSSADFAFSTQVLDINERRNLIGGGSFRGPSRAPSCRSSIFCFAKSPGGQAKSAKKKDYAEYSPNISIPSRPAASFSSLSGPVLRSHITIIRRLERWGNFVLLVAILPVFLGYFSSRVMSQP